MLELGRKLGSLIQGKTEVQSSEYVYSFNIQDGRNFIVSKTGKPKKTVFIIQDETGLEHGRIPGELKDINGAILFKPNAVTINKIPQTDPHHGRGIVRTAYAEAVGQGIITIWESSSNLTPAGNHIYEALQVDVRYKNILKIEIIPQKRLFSYPRYRITKYQ